VQRYLLVLAFAAMSDDPRLEPALATVWPGRATAVVPIEAGITNRNYRVEVDGETFVLRLAGTDTELLGIDRAAEVEAGRVAAEAGVGPEVVAFEPDLGCIVTRFVGGSPIPEEELGNERVMRSVVSSIRAIHGSRPIRATFPVFRIVEGFREIAAARGVRVPDDYEAAHAVAGRIEDAFAAAPAPLTTCHNDLLNANFLLEGDHTWIVDYEYAGMGDPFFDLGNLSINNNISQLGVPQNVDLPDLAYSGTLRWQPTTGEFGLYGTFGDYDYHDKLATRLAIHYTSSTEDKQSQPGADGIENSQIRLTDGSVIFTPNLFGDGITVNRVKYRMSSLDGGLKYKGLSFEAEYYWRWLSGYEGANVSGIPDIDDHGYQIQASAMPIPKLLQVYFGNSGVYGKYGNPWEYRFGTSVYPVKQRGFRVNAEVIHIDHSPVGYTAYPMPVGATGNVFHVNWEMNF